MSCASYQERKDLSAELKKIYRAPNAEAAEAALDAFEESELGKRYSDVVRSWRTKWDLVIPFLAFSAPIRKVLSCHAVAGYIERHRKLEQLGASRSENARVRRTRRHIHQ